jgi:hypothetical protein
VEPRIRTKRGHIVAKRFPALAIIAASAFFISGASTALAADPGFCRSYAQAAINQVRGALSNPACVGGVQGNRWSSDFQVHYEWCLGASFTATGAERDARTRMLRQCAGR